MTLSPRRLVVSLGCIIRILLISVVNSSSSLPSSVENNIFTSTTPSKTRISSLPSKPETLQIRASPGAAFLHHPSLQRLNFRNKICSYKKCDLPSLQKLHFRKVPSTTTTSLFQKSSSKRDQNTKSNKNNNSQQSSTERDSNNKSNSNKFTYPPIRLNKVLKATHSRRQSDMLIQQGRLSVNGATVLPSNYDGNERNQMSNQSGEKSDGNEAGMGMKVIPYVDVVRLDGVVVQGWEELHGFFPPEAYEGHQGFNDGVDFLQGKGKHKGGSGGSRKKHTIIRTLDDPLDDTQKSEHTNNYRNSNKNQITNYQYIKYWKPRGVICTTDRSIRHNILEELEFDGYFPPHRVFPVGRLDKDTSGLILITSDGRLPNSVLRGQAKQPKTYQVKVDKKLRLDDLDHLRNGVVITTYAQRDKQKKMLTAPTLPSIVHQTGINSLEITIFEGRNRQIRKMLEALGYTVVMLHRVEFMKIGLEPLEREGDWAELSLEEMKMIDELIA